MLLTHKKLLINNTVAQVAVEFLIVFIIFAGFMFYIYGLGVSLAGLQHAEYYGFMVGRSITASAKRYGSGTATGSGRTKYSSAQIIRKWYNDDWIIDSVGQMECGLDTTTAYRKILFYSDTVGPNIASNTGVACKVSASRLLPVFGAGFELAFDVMMGSDISDDHAECAMSFKKNWKECLNEDTTASTTEVIVFDNGT